MAWGKTDEEKQAEAAAQQRAAVAEAERQRLAAEAREVAAYRASPAGLAETAFANGDWFFQIQLDVSQLSGAPSFFGSSGNEVQTTGNANVLAQIEGSGWHLEHVGYVFIETGSTSTNRMLVSGEGTVTRGIVQGVYLFRRSDPATTALP